MKKKNSGKKKKRNAKIKKIWQPSPASYQNMHDDAVEHIAKHQSLESMKKRKEWNTCCNDICQKDNQPNCIFE